MKTIGLIGGMSWESTTSYYQIINETIKKELGGLHSAKILLYSVDFAEIEHYQAVGDWEKSGQLLADVAKSLEQAGADFIVICTNTMHKVAPQIQEQITIPILHIAQATAQALLADGIQRVGLLGTKYTMTQDFYKEKLIESGLEVLIPDQAGIIEVNRIIYDELCLGDIKESSKQTYLAVIDDLIAIIVIAIFYASSIHMMYLGVAVVVVAALIYCNKQGYVRPLPYIILGFILWYCVLKSGLHATMAGVILAMTIPSKGKRGRKYVRPMQHWEHLLSNWVSFLIVPIFAFFNAGVDLRNVSVNDLTHPVVLGVALGLIIGKQLGIFGAVFAMVKCGLVPMPTEANWKHVYGTAIVCGIGFTMSIFVSILAFEPGHAQEMAKGGVILGSLISALFGYIFLRLVGANRKECHIGVYHNC